MHVHPGLCTEILLRGGGVEFGVWKKERGGSSIVLCTCKPYICYAALTFHRVFNKSCSGFHPSNKKSGMKPCDFCPWIVSRLYSQVAVQYDFVYGVRKPINCSLGMASLYMNPAPSNYSYSYNIDHCLQSIGLDIVETRKF